MDENKNTDVEVLSDFDDLLSDDTGAVGNTKVAFEEQSPATAVEAPNTTNIFGVEDSMLPSEEVPASPVGPMVPEMPVPPVAPVGPMAPEMPVPPVAPVGPMAPEMPVPPVAPVGPMAPEMPVPPVAPVGPMAPEMPVPPVAPVEPMAPEMPVPPAPMGTPSVAPTMPVGSMDETGVQPVDSATNLAEQAGMSATEEHPSAQIKMGTGIQTEPVMEQRNKITLEKSTRKNLIFIAIIGVILLAVIIILPFVLK